MKKKQMNENHVKRFLSVMLIFAFLITGIACSNAEQVNAAPSGAYTLHLGCDVSQFQGKINWAQMRTSGIEFALIRVGTRNSKTGVITEDTRYAENITGALNNGIRVGVYIFSQAITPAEAVEEADFLISRIYNYNITLPIVIDYEFRNDPTTNAPGRLRAAGLSKESGTAVVNSFCDRIRSAGYTPMVYANKTMLNNYLNPDAITGVGNRVWLAHYTEASDYNGLYDFWQFTSKASGTSYGASSTYLDLNYWYDNGTIYGKDYSSVFNPTYYSTLYPDVAATCGGNISAMLQHFINIGMPQGRCGSPLFNPVSYRNAYPDLRNTFKTDWKSYYTHYMTGGIWEGRVGTGFEDNMLGGLTTYKDVDYSAVYNPGYYAAHNPDLVAAYGYDESALIKHFVNCGIKEGRQACANFNVSSYIAHNPDLVAAFGENNNLAYIKHYINNGQKEGRVAVD